MRRRRASRPLRRSRRGSRRSDRRRVWCHHGAGNTSFDSFLRLRPLEFERYLPWMLDETCRRLEAVIRSLPRWHVEKADAVAGEIHLTRRTPVFRFVDDIRLRLEAVPGVAKVAVSYKDKTATIVYDDAKADVNQLTSATTQAGYPSAPKS